MSGFQLSRGTSTKLSALTSLRPLHLSSRHEVSPHMSPAASRSALRASAYRSQCNSTRSTCLSPRPYSRIGLSMSFFLNKRAFSPPALFEPALRWRPRPRPALRTSGACARSTECSPSSTYGIPPRRSSQFQVLGPLCIDQTQHACQLAHPPGRGACRLAAFLDGCSCSLPCFSYATILLPLDTRDTVTRWSTISITKTASAVLRKTPRPILAF